MKKRRLKKFPIFVLILLIIMCLGYFILFNSKDNNKKSKNSNQKYSEKSFSKMEELDIKNKVNLKKYSETLDVAIFDEYFQHEYVNNYENIDYVETDNFIDLVNIMLDRNIDEKTISKTISELIKCPNYDKHNFERYLSFKEINNDLDYQTVVTRVNIKLDKEFYTDTEAIKDPDNLYVVVNKYNYLDDSFVPKNLTPLFNNTNATMVKEAADAYKELVEAGRYRYICFL